MKVYTQEIDIALQSPKRFWVAPFSDFKIGVKIVKNGTPVDNEFTVKKGTTTLTPDADLVDGFKTYTIKSGATGFEEYTIEISGVGEAQKLTQIITDSTVFDIDAGGGDVPSDVATQSWVESYVSAETSAFIDETALSSYAKTSEVASIYATKTELSDYATTSEMESYVSTATSNFVTASEVDSAISTATSNFVSATDVSSAISAATSEFQTASQVSSAISAATSNKVTGGRVGSAPVVSSTIAVYETDWATLSASADANTFYVVLPDQV